MLFSKDPFKKNKGEKHFIPLYAENKTLPYMLHLPKHPSTSEYSHLDTWVFTVEVHQLLTQQNKFLPLKLPGQTCRGKNTPPDSSRALWTESL